jgi:WD40 repeat protein
LDGLGTNNLLMSWRLVKKLALAFSVTIAVLACSLAGVLRSATPPAPTIPASIEAPTATSRPPSPVPPTPTPLPPAISADTVALLWTYLGFADGELVRSLAYSPDGTVLAAAVGDEAGIIQLYDSTSGQPLRALQGHQSIVWGLAFSPDGLFLASASRDHTAKVWDWHSGSLLQSLVFPDEVTSVAFSPDSRTLAVGGVDGWPKAAIWTYAVDSWEPLMKLEESWNIPDIAFSPDGTKLVGGGTSRNVRIWRTSDGAELSVLYHAGQVSSIAISPDGSTVATGLCEASETGDCTRGAVWLWDLATGRLIQKLSDFPDWVEGVVFSPDGSLVVAGSREGTVNAYAASGYRLLLDTALPLGTSPPSILAVSISPDGRFLATGGVGKIGLWKVGP